MNKAEPTLALKPGGDITRSPKQGYQWPHKKDVDPPEIKKNYERPCRGHKCMIRSMQDKYTSTSN